MEPANGFVTLGDGQTKLQIQGIGTVKCIIDGQDIFIKDFHFVPELSESIYSLLQHIKQPNHGLHSSYETGLYLKFPNFRSKAKSKNDKTSSGHKVNLPFILYYHNDASYNNNHFFFQSKKKKSLISKDLSNRNAKQEEREIFNKYLLNQSAEV